MSEQPLTIVGVARARAERVDDLKEILLSFARLARAEPGCLDFSVHQDTADPEVLVFVEEWSTEGDFQRHLAQPYMVAFAAEQARYLQEDIAVRSLVAHGPLPGTPGPHHRDQAGVDGAPAALHVPAGRGSSVWFGEATYTFKAAAATTAGVLTFAEASVPPGNGPPPHVHAEVDEAFFVLAGELEFLDGDRTFLAGAGDFVFIPHGVRHRFRAVGVHVARVLFFFVPGGMDGYFTEIGTEARAGETGPPLTEEQLRQVVALAPRYGLSIVP